MRKFVILLILLAHTAQAQDEREFRKLFATKKQQPIEKEEEPKLVLQTGFYEYDLDGDKKNERLQLLTKDGINFLKILTQTGELLREVEFQAKGINANLYKLRTSYVKPGVLTIIFYFDEGFTKSVSFKSTARTYFLTVKNKNWKDSVLTKGPAYFVEHEMVQGRYYKRGYHVNFLDYNNDGIKEISVTFGKIQRIYLYQNEVWKEFL